MKKLFNKKAFALLLCLVLALTALLTVTAFADTAPADGTAAQTEARTVRQTVTDYCDNMLKTTEETMAENAAQAQNVAIAKSAEGIARQPEAEGKIRTTMMLGLVFLETAIIYALLVVILIIFVL